jgi:hypothetical protein
MTEKVFVIFHSSCIHTHNTPSLVLCPVKYPPVERFQGNDPTAFTNSYTSIQDPLVNEHHKMLEISIVKTEGRPKTAWELKRRAKAEPVSLTRAIIDRTLWTERRRCGQKMSLNSRPQTDQSRLALETLSLKQSTNT